MRIIIESAFNLSDDVKKVFDLSDDEPIENLFDSDPDLIKIDGIEYQFITAKEDDKWYIIYLGDKNAYTEKYLLLFVMKDFQKFYERIEGKGWADYHNNDNVIAYRGGRGYVYAIWKLRGEYKR